MEIEKLAELSCLKVNKESKEKIEISINSIVKMMKEIENINAIEVKKQETNSNILREDILDVDLLVEKDNCNSLHFEEGLFLAPKTVKK